MKQDGKSLNLKTKVLVVSGWALLLERKMVTLCNSLLAENQLY